MGSPTFFRHHNAQHLILATQAKVGFIVRKWVKDGASNAEMRETKPPKKLGYIPNHSQQFYEEKCRGIP